MAKRSPPKPAPESEAKEVDQIGGLQVIYLPVDELKPYERNSRTHTAEQIQQIANSIKSGVGWTNPIIIRAESKQIIAGHARVEAAKLLGLEKVPCIPKENLTDEEVRAYVIADNKLAENAGWDFDVLGGEIGALVEAGFDVSLLGFSQSELSSILKPPGEEGKTHPDETPEVEQSATSVLGDVWILGPHRLVCGDCTVMEYVDKCLNGVTPNLMVTDPPYGVEYDPSHRVRSGLAKKGQVAEGKVLNDDRADWREAWALFPGAVAYVWHAGTKAHIVAESLVACGFEIRSQIVWVKNRFAISRGHYHVQHEPAFEARKDDEEGATHETAQYAVRKGDKASWAGDRKQSTCWFIDHIRNDTGHGTQKPVECMARPIRNNSSPGQAVYEPFCGSGTTIIACQREGRVCHAIELDPRYADLIVRRWQNYTGQTAVLEATGQSFNDVVGERAVEPSEQEAGSDD